MSLFGAIPISGSGINAMQAWIDTLAGNLANINDAVPANKVPYREQTPVVMPASTALGNQGEGVAVVGIALGNTTGKIAYQPGNPLADAQGYVRYPDISMSQQLVDLVQAQASYQANVSALQKAQSAYQSALTLGS